MKIKLLPFFIAFQLFVLTAAGQPQLLHQFGGSPDGNASIASLIADGTFLYGTTYKGGTGDFGSVFKVMTDGTGYSKLYDFDGASNGIHPYGALFLQGNFLYGMTSEAGTNGFGTLFKIQTNGTNYSKLLDFGSITVPGQNPIGSLISDGTYLYGMTQNGGGIFKVDTNGTGYTITHQFDGTHGGTPYDALISDGTFFYGMTSTGGDTGANHLGIIFKIMPDGSSFTILYEFTGLNGSTPNGSLYYDGTTLFGTTQSGGLNDKGEIFKIMPDGTGFTSLLDFDGNNGRRPGSGSLVSNGTYLYGLAARGGAGDLGLIYRIKKDGTAYSDMYDFEYNHGAYPGASLFYDGTFVYGTTSNGGVNTAGVVFKFDLSAFTGIEDNKQATDYTISPNPFSSQLTFSLPDNVPTALSLYNFLGQQVLRQSFTNSTTVYTEQLAEGIYFYKLRSNKGTLKTGKLVKQ